jgi:hypothetical protein
MVSGSEPRGAAGCPRVSESSPGTSSRAGSGLPSPARGRRSMGAPSRRTARLSSRAATARPQHASRPADRDSCNCRKAAATSARRPTAAANQSVWRGCAPTVREHIRRPTDTVPSPVSVRKPPRFRGKSWKASPTAYRSETAVLQDFLRTLRIPRSACHAEGRGFESLQPLFG